MHFKQLYPGIQLEYPGMCYADYPYMHTHTYKYIYIMDGDTGIMRGRPRIWACNIDPGM